MSEERGSDARDSWAPNSLTLKTATEWLRKCPANDIDSPHKDPNDLILSSRFPQTVKVENFVLHSALRDQVKKHIEMVRALVDVSIKFYISSHRGPIT
jgi:hypothetical protein